MSSLISRITVSALFFASLFMLGCSSGGGGDAGAAAPLYSGATTPAAITQGNADEITQKSAEGVNEAVSLTSAGAAIPFFPVGVQTVSGADVMAQKVGEVVFSVLEGSTPLNLPAAAVLTADDLNGGASGFFCGGSVSVPDNIDPNATTQDFTMSFNQLCFDDGVTVLTMSGSLRFQANETSFTISFSNFSVTIDGTKESFSGVFSCDAALANCTIATDYAGSDGNIYRLANVDISGDATLGYTVGATFYHHELGQVTIATTTPVTYGGCGIYPSGGAITISSSDGSSVTVTFSGCSYSITGADANTGSISINGSWT